MRTAVRALTGLPGASNAKTNWPCIHAPDVPLCTSWCQLSAVQYSACPCNQDNRKLVCTDVQQKKRMQSQTEKIMSSNLGLLPVHWLENCSLQHEFARTAWDFVSSSLLLINSIMYSCSFPEACHDAAGTAWQDLSFACGLKITPAPTSTLMKMRCHCST